MSNYPVGATFEAKNDSGKIGKIWLAERHEGFEVWRYSVAWDDGSGYQSEWFLSYRKCREEIPLFNSDFKTPKFKRVS